MKKVVNVSVVIPAYNAEKYIEDCIQSVVSQTVEPKEVIVVDDGSSDSTRSLVAIFEEKFINIRCISKQNAGLSKARNTGIEAAKGDYIAFLDSDDMWHEDKLEKQLELFSIKKSLGMVYSAYELCDEHGRRYQGNITPPSVRDHVLDDLIQYGNLISGSGSGVLVKKEVLEKVGLFDGELKFAEDLDMWIRIAEHYSVDFVNEVLVIIRTHTDSMQAKYTSHYSRFMANWPLYSKHSAYFTTKRNLKKIRFDAVNASINSLIRGATSYHGVNTLSHAKKLQLGEFSLFNNWFIFSFSIVENVFRRGLYKFVITVKRLFAKD